MNDLTDSAAADLERAEGLVGQALATSPRSPLAHFAKGQCCAAGPIRGGHSRIRDGARVQSQLGEAHYANLGQCKLFTGSIDEAIPLAGASHPPQPPRSLIGDSVFHDWIRHTCCNRAPTRRSSGSKKRATLSPSSTQYTHAFLAAAYALKGETERAAAELAEARRLSTDDRYSSIARLKADLPFSSATPKIRALFEATYFAGLRKAGMPEE